jgi:uracil-DNA glycosylase
LGQRAYESVLRIYDLKPLVFRQAVDGHQPIVLSNGVSVFAVYHCSRRILNTHRDMRQQQRDWQYIGTWIRAHSAA